MATARAVASPLSHAEALDPGVLAPTPRRTTGALWMRNIREGAVVGSATVVLLCSLFVYAGVGLLRDGRPEGGPMIALSLLVMVFPLLALHSVLSEVRRFRIGRLVPVEIRVMTLRGAAPLRPGPETGMPETWIRLGSLVRLRYCFGDQRVDRVSDIPTGETPAVVRLPEGDSFVVIVDPRSPGDPVVVTRELLAAAGYDTAR